VTWRSASTPPTKPLLGVIAAPRAANAREPAIIGTQIFVDSTPAKTSAYSFSATVPTDCTLMVMLYGIGPVSQAPIARCGCSPARGFALDDLRRGRPGAAR
jgi:hypothetical protein